MQKYLCTEKLRVCYVAVRAERQFGHLFEPRGIYRLPLLFLIAAEAIGERYPHFTETGIAVGDVLRLETDAGSYFLRLEQVVAV